MEHYKMLEKALKSVRQKTDFVPLLGIVLGSGLGGLADEIKTVAVADYKDIEGFPVSTVPGHKGRLVFGYIGKTAVVIMQGRVHMYEGYSPQLAVMPVRLMGMLGCKNLLLTNAAGGVNTSFKPGDLMVIRDHISCFVPSPLMGENVDELGTRFPDMSNVYNNDLCEIMLKTADNINFTLREGVYCQLTGPQYETPAEIKMLRTLGADAVGMSTVCEAIAAVHCGIRVCGVSCITNMAAGISKNPLSHSEVQETADKTSKVFRSLVRAFAENVGDSYENKAL